MLQVRAYDASDNVGTSPSIVVNVAVQSDATPPRVAITYPADNALVPRNTRVTIAAEASDNVGVVAVDFLVNGNLICNSRAAPCTCARSVPARPRAGYMLEARAGDAAGNQESMSVHVTAN